MKLFNLAKQVVFTSALVVAVACTKKSATADYGLSVDDTLRVSISTEPPSLDWSKATDTTSAQVISNIMDGLVAYDFNDPELKLIPALATKWTASNNAKTWTLDLRTDVKWTDGQLFKAQNVIDGWERLLNAKTASEYAYALFPIKNAQEYNQGKVKDFSEVGVKATSDSQIVVELNSPMAFFPMLLTHHSTFPLRKDIVDKFGDKWTDPANIVTLGAYNLKKWEHDKAIVLERNEGFYDTKAKIKNILCYMINEPSTTLNLFNSGKLDSVDELPKTEIEVLAKRPEHVSKGVLVLYYYGFNVNKAPFNNPKVRKAFSMAINRDEIVKMMKGGDLAMSGWVPQGMFGHEDAVGLKTNIEQAKALLKEAGFEDPKKLGKIEIGFNTNANHQRIAENVQAQLKKNLGVNVELKNEEWKVYLNTLKTDAPQIFRMGWQADYPDPDNFMVLMTSTSENNRTGWKNKKYDEVVQKASSELDKEKRKSLYTQAQKILLEEDAPAVPVYTSVSHHLVAPRVVNYPINALGQFIYKNTSLKK